MSATREEVEQLVRGQFANAEVELQEHNHRVTGVIYWPDFGSMSSEQRNRLVTERVRNRLGYQGLNIGFLLPLASKDEF